VALGRTLADEGLDPKAKLAACDGFLRREPTHAMRGEVQAIRAIFGAANEDDRAAAIRAYFRDYADGRLAGRVGYLRSAVGEEDAFKELASVLGSSRPGAQKLLACRGYVRRYPVGANRDEVDLLAAAFSARSQEEETQAWLAYRMKFPSGILKEYADGSLRRSEPLMLVQVKNALAGGDDELTVSLGQVYLALFPAGPAVSEVRSLTSVLKQPLGPDRQRAAKNHLANYKRGTFTETLEAVVRAWERKGAEADIGELREALVKAGGRAARQKLLAAFLAGDRGKESRQEVAALQAIFSLDKAKSRLEAARRYVETYPAGTFADLVEGLNAEILSDRDEEAFLEARSVISNRSANLASKLAAVEAYLAELPEGAHAQEISDAGVEIRGVIAEEGRAFAGLDVAGSLEDRVRVCDEYLRRFPGGAHVQEVIDRQAKLGRELKGEQEEAAFAALAGTLGRGDVPRLRKADECLAFLAAYPSGRHKREVTGSLKTLAPGEVGPFAGPARSAVFSADSQRLFVVDASARFRQSGVWVWSVAETKLAARYSTKPAVTVTFAVHAPEENVVWLGEDSGGLIAWNVATGDVVGRHRLGLNAIRGISTARRGAMVVAASYGDSRARAWDRSKWSLMEDSFRCKGGLAAAAMDPAGGYVAVAGTDGRIAVYRVGSEGAPLWEAADAHTKAVDFVCFSEQGQYLASTSTAEGTVAVWGAQTGKMMWRVGEKSDEVAFIGAERLLTSGSVRAVNQDGRQVAALDGAGPVTVSPDARFAFTGGKGNAGTLWYLPALFAE